MNPTQIAVLLAGLGLLTTLSARADSCALTVEANDLMRFNQNTLQVSSSCSEVQVTLKHVGKLPRTAMGHDWVLAKTANVTAIVNAGVAAGLARNYLQSGDSRVIAATPVIGGGESATVTVAMSALQPSGDYTFFCSYPGHAAIMRGKFIVTSG
jgi:azurin